jgi:hypothetical protein
VRLRFAAAAAFEILRRAAARCVELAIRYLQVDCRLARIQHLLFRCQNRWLHPHKTRVSEPMPPVRLALMRTSGDDICSAMGASPSKVPIGWLASDSPARTDPEEQGCIKVVLKPQGRDSKQTPADAQRLRRRHGFAIRCLVVFRKHGPESFTAARVACCCASCPTCTCEQQESAIAVVLSGTGTNGSVGGLQIRVPPNSPPDSSYTQIGL